MKIVQVSESNFSVKGHGVHTAFTETVKALRTSTKHKVAINSFSHADIRHIHTVGIYSLLHLLVFSGKKVVSAHVVPGSFQGSLVAVKYWLPLATLYLRWFYNRADAVVAVSDATKTQLVKLGVKRPISVVNNMVDTKIYQNSATKRTKARAELGIADDATVIVANGQVQPRKGVRTFVDVARKSPEWSFIWVGGMPFGRVAASHAEMEELIASAPQNVIFTGVIDHASVGEYFAAADVFFLPSHQETFGISVVEAAATGLPIVLRDISDYDATFRGYAVMATNASFKESIKKIVDNATYRKSLILKSQQIANAYDSRVIIQQLIQVYETALAS